MYSKYFVLVTDKCFGVFEIGAKYYPEAFLNNMEFVSVIQDTQLEKYLLDKVGRNCLVQSRFKLYMSFGNVYHR